MQGVEIRAIPNALVNQWQRPEHGECNCIECGNVQGFNQCLEEQGKVKITLERKKLAKRIYKISNRFHFTEESLEIIFTTHYKTWNPSVNEAFVIADEINTHLNELLVAVKEGKE